MKDTIHARYASMAPWLIWGLAAFFFFAHYVVRVTPGHITAELQATFIGTTKLDIGVIGAAFYLPYVLMQMPVGFLVDRFGPRLLLTIAVLMCSVSSLLFASATVMNMAILSRILLGFCSATAFIGALKLTTVWFEPKKLALLVGVTQALGMIGAGLGGQIVPHLTETIGWRNAFILYAVAFFILSILIFTIVRNHPNGKVLANGTTIESKPIRMDQIWRVLFNRYTWLNALYAGLIYAPTDAMGELWGKDFIEKIHHLTSKEASHCVSFIFFGWAIGGPLAGWIADRVGRKPVMVVSAILGLVLLPILFYVPDLSTKMIILITFTYGLTNTGLIACYTTAGELHDKSLGGFSMAIANMFSVLLGALFMPLLGWLLNWHASSHLAADGSVMFTVADYQHSTFILPLCLFLAIICAAFNKETRVRHSFEENSKALVKP